MIDNTSTFLQKQEEVEQLIAEASDRLAKATVSDNKAELLADQALLQSGNTKLMEARKAQEQLESVPPSKKKLSSQGAKWNFVVEALWSKDSCAPQ